MRCRWWRCSGWGEFCPGLGALSAGGLFGCARVVCGRGVGSHGEYLDREAGAVVDWVGVDTFGAFILSGLAGSRCGELRLIAKLTVSHMRPRADAAAIFVD